LAEVVDLAAKAGGKEESVASEIGGYVDIGR